MSYLLPQFIHSNGLKELACFHTDPPLSILDKETTRKLLKNINHAIAKLRNNNTEQLHNSIALLTFIDTNINRIVQTKSDANQEQ